MNALQTFLSGIAARNTKVVSIRRETPGTNQRKEDNQALAHQSEIIEGNDAKPADGSETDISSQTAMGSETANGLRDARIEIEIGNARPLLEIEEGSGPQEKKGEKDACLVGLPTHGLSPELAECRTEALFSAMLANLPNRANTLAMVPAAQQTVSAAPGPIPSLSLASISPISRSSVSRSSISKSSISKSMASQSTVPKSSLPQFAVSESLVSKPMLAEPMAAQAIAS